MLQSLEEGQKRIAVLGSVHVDIIGVSEDVQDRLDKVGRIDVRLGGSAFNVAINLARIGHKVSVWTTVRTGSVLEKWIIGRFKREGISTRVISRDRRAEAGAFVANKHEGQYVSAVTSTGIDKINLPNWRIQSLIRWSQSVVVDCNLSSYQLSQVVKFSERLGRPTIISGVSETKVRRFAEAQELSQSKVRALATDQRIFESLANYFSNRGITDIKAMMQTLRLSIIGVFDKFEKIDQSDSYKVGMKLIFSDGSTEYFEELINGTATRTGARDALACGLAILDKKLDASDPNEVARAFKSISWPIMCRVIESDRTTIGSIKDEATFDNFGIEQEYIPLRVLVLRSVVGAFNRLAQIAAGGLAFMAALQQLFPNQISTVTNEIIKMFVGG